MDADGRLSPRKKPRQRRSQQTVDAILQAAARIFAERGLGGGTTNHIAALAGVSVGSLYEYFPNKDAILVAVVERQLEAMIRDVQEHLLSARSGPDSAEPLDALLRRFVLAMLEVHEREPDLYRTAASEAPHPPALDACVLQMEQVLAHVLKDLLDERAELDLPDTDTVAHLIFQTTEALTHRYVHYGIHELEREAFVKEVVTLLDAYLSVGRPG